MSFQNSPRHWNRGCVFYYIFRYNNNGADYAEISDYADLKTVNEWLDSGYASLEPVDQWLENIGMVKYTENFTKKGYIKTHQILDLTSSDLQELGIFAMGHKDEIIRAIEDTKEKVRYFRIYVLVFKGGGQDFWTREGLGIIGMILVKMGGFQLLE